MSATLVEEYLERRKSQGVDALVSELHAHFDEVDGVENDRIGHILAANIARLEDETGRDGNQPEAGNRIRTHDLLPFYSGMGELDEMLREYKQKLIAMEDWGGAHYDVSVRFLGEDAYETPESVRKVAPNVRQKNLWRSDKGLGYDLLEPEIIKEAIRQAVEAGQLEFRVYNYSNDRDALKASIKAINEVRQEMIDAGITDEEKLPIAEGASCYNNTLDPNEPDEERVWPLHGPDGIVEDMIQMAQAGAQKLALKDYSGFLKEVEGNKEATRVCTAIIEGLKKAKEEGRIDFIPEVTMHSHGDKPHVLKAALDCGFSYVNTCVGEKLSGGFAHTNMLKMLDLLMSDPKYTDGEDITPEEYQQHPLYKKLVEQQEYINKISPKYAEFRLEGEMRAAQEDIDNSRWAGGSMGAFYAATKAGWKGFLNIWKKADVEAMEPSEFSKAAYDVANELWLRDGQYQSVTPGSKISQQTASVVTAYRHAGKEAPLAAYLPDYHELVTGRLGGQLRAIELGKVDMAVLNTLLWDDATKTIKALERSGELPKGVLDTSDMEGEIYTNAFKDHEALEELRESFTEKLPYTPDGFRDFALKAMSGESNFTPSKQYLEDDPLDALREKVEELRQAGKISDEVAEKIARSSMAGKKEVKPGGLDNAYNAIDGIIDDQIRHYEFDGAAITLPTQKYDQEKIDSGKQVAIPGNNELAINRARAAITIAMAQPESAEYTFKYKHTGIIPKGSKIEVEPYADLEQTITDSGVISEDLREKMGEIIDLRNQLNDPAFSGRNKDNAARIVAIEKEVNEAIAKSLTPRLEEMGLSDDALLPIDRLERGYAAAWVVLEKQAINVAKEKEDSPDKKTDEQLQDLVRNLADKLGEQKYIQRQAEKVLSLLGSGDESNTSVAKAEQALAEARNEQGSISRQTREMLRDEHGFNWSQTRAMYKIFNKIAVEKIHGLKVAKEASHTKMGADTIHTPDRDEDGYPNSMQRDDKPSPSITESGLTSEQIRERAAIINIPK